MINVLSFRRFGRAACLLGFVVVALVACGKKDQQAAQQTSQGASQTTQAAPVSTEPPALSTLPIEELLKRGKVAESKDQLVTPAGDNAIEYYLAVVEKDPNNAIASQAVIDIFPLASGVVERLLQQRELDEADRIIKMLSAAQPDSYTVKTLATRLTSMRENLVREEEQRKQQEERARLEAEQAARLAAQQQTSPQAAATPSSAQQAAQERAAREAAAAAESVATTTQPATTPTTQPVVERPSGGETRAAKLVRSGALNYPQNAYRRRQEGWVEIEATVGPTGAVTNVVVTRAEPARVFDREAINAAEKWQFDPALRDGKPVESKYRRRIEFKL